MPAVGCDQYDFGKGKKGTYNYRGRPYSKFRRIPLVLCKQCKKHDDCIERERAELEAAGIMEKRNYIRRKVKRGRNV